MKAATNNARTNTRFAGRTRQQWAIARRATARRRVANGAAPVEMRDPGLTAACLEAAGFEEHRNHYA